MYQINISKAKTDFYKIIAMVENEEENEIVITKYGKSVAKITKYFPMINGDILQQD